MPRLKLIQPSVNSAPCEAATSGVQNSSSMQAGLPKPTYSTKASPALDSTVKDAALAAFSRVSSCSDLRGSTTRECR